MTVTGGPQHPLTRACPEPHCGRQTTEPATIGQRIDDLATALNRAIGDTTAWIRVHQALTTIRIEARRHAGEPVQEPRSA
jgi:hypothetical protein